MTDALVVLKNSAGADEANVNGVSYARHADERFYVPEEVAQRLTGTRQASIGRQKTTTQNPELRR